MSDMDVTLTINVGGRVVLAVEQQASSSEITQTLRTIADGFNGLRTRLAAVEAREDQFMTQQEDASKKLDRLEAAFTEVSKDITELKALAAPALDDATMARFEAIAAKYEKLGADTVAGGPAPVPGGGI